MYKTGSKGKQNDLPGSKSNYQYKFLVVCEKVLRNERLSLADWAILETRLRRFIFKFYKTSDQNYLDYKTTDRILYFCEYIKQYRDYLSERLDKGFDVYYGQYPFHFYINSFFFDYNSVETIFILKAHDYAYSEKDGNCLIHTYLWSKKLKRLGIAMSLWFQYKPKNSQEWLDAYIKWRLSKNLGGQPKRDVIANFMSVASQVEAIFGNKRSIYDERVI